MNIKEIQDYYDTEGCSWRELCKKFNISVNLLYRMKKRGEFISRTKSEATKIQLQKNPRKHSQKTKEKISKIRKDFLIKNPDKIPYKLNHHSQEKSYPEKYFKKCFGNKFIEQYSVNLYSLDFADIEKRWDIEIDGNQHNSDQRIIKHDLKRNKILNDLGWNVIRINWSEFSKLNKENKVLIIKSLLNGLIPQQKSITFFPGNNNISAQEFELYIQNKDRKICPICRGAKSFVSNSCNKCHQEQKRKSKMPDKSILEELIITNSMENIGKKYNVSGKTIKNWLNYYNISLPYLKGQHVKYYWFSSGYDDFHKNGALGDS